MISDEWIRQAVLNASDEAASGVAPVPHAVERLDMLLRAWAVGLAAQREDVQGATLRLGRRGLHQDEAAAFLRALDLGLLHVDSAGYATSMCSRPKDKGGGMR